MFPKIWLTWANVCVADLSLRRWPGARTYSQTSIDRIDAVPSPYLGTSVTDQRAASPATPWSPVSINYKNIGEYFIL